MNRMENGNLQRGLEVGSLIAGKYRIDRTLAEGGMGVVVAATHIHLDQIIALKFLRGDVSSEFDALARFTREARAAAQLRSEYVARVLDAGVTDDGTPYIAMEYLEGQSLAHSLQANGPLDVARAVEYVIQVCEGLSEAHARGIIHRDIKPDNLFLVERSPGWSAVKILDFGISKFAFAEAGHIATGIIIGSPCYMSPEQLRSTATVDHRTDIWSVGTTLYELLAGGAAFDASQTLPELITAILHGPTPEIHAVRPEVPSELSAIIARCLVKDRNGRFESAGELAMALLPFGPSRARIPAERAASMKPRSADAVTTDRSLGPISTLPPSPLSSAPPSRKPPALRLAASNDIARASEEPPGPSSQLVTPVALTIAEEKTPEPADESRPILARPWLTWLTWRRVAVAAAAAIALLVFVTRGRGGKADGDVPVLAPVPPVAAVTGHEAAATAAHETLPPVSSASGDGARVEIVVRASPAGAQITIDDKPVANPYVGAYPKDGKMHRVAAHAWGYEPKSEDVLLTGDTIIDLGLYRRASASGPAVAPASEAPKRAVAPIATEGASARPTVASSAREVDPSGGRTPLRPIDTKDPYAAP